MAEISSATYSLPARLDAHHAPSGPGHDEVRDGVDRVLVPVMTGQVATVGSGQPSLTVARMASLSVAVTSTLRGFAFSATGMVSLQQLGHLPAVPLDRSNQHLMVCPIHAGGWGVRAVHEREPRAPGGTSYHVIAWTPAPLRLRG
jgi:hypothetical protein